MPALFDEIGEENLRSLVESFYDIVETDPAAEALHRLHLRGHGIGHSRIEQFDFLSGFLGGPQLYVRKYGRANLRAMHAHVAIGTGERGLWLDCMERAVARVGLAPEIGRALMQHLRRVVRTIGQDATGRDAGGAGAARPTNRDTAHRSTP